MHIFSTWGTIAKSITKLCIVPPRQTPRTQKGWSLDPAKNVVSANCFKVNLEIMNATNGMSVMNARGVDRSGIIPLTRMAAEKLRVVQPLETLNCQPDIVYEMIQNSKNGGILISPKLPLCLFWLHFEHKALLFLTKHVAEAGSR